MSTIAFCVHPMTGSVHASLKLARDLRSAGHRVCYLGLADCEQYVRPYEFEFISVFEQWFPKDWFKPPVQHAQSAKGIKRVFLRRKTLALIKAFVEKLVQGEDKLFLDVIRTLSPDLIIIVATHYDAFIWALLAHKAGVNSLYLHDTWCHSSNSRIPPITTGIIPKDSVASRVTTVLAWQVFFLKRFIDRKILTLGIDLYSPRLIIALAKSCHYPIEYIDISTDLLAPKLRLPELVLGTQDLDFPGADGKDRHYIGASIDTERVEPSFPWERLDMKCPLVYCALGSLPLLQNREYARFYQGLIDVAKLWPQWQWVISLGSNLTGKAFDSVPQNVILVNHAPQIALLKRALFMINHGGTNTVRECAFFGVRMIVFALQFDQYGNSARVVYRGLGVRGEFKKVSVAYLGSLIATLERSPYFRIQAKLMQQALREAESKDLGRKIIETALMANDHLRESVL